MFSKILIAGRGEIAVRIIRACREMGIATVAVYSEADRETLHVAMADESYCIGGASPADSYLNMNQIISAALVSGAQAIHPGYGFLSENADFAEACRQNNLTFIGPSAEQMRRLSNKETAKNLMAEAGLEIIPGCGVLKDADEALAEGRKVGYPLMLKAVSGGGGRGIRLVRTEDELEKAYQTSVAEALNAFGDGGIYMEKYINPARHIEFQILADEQGNVVCLGDRDCTLQVNNQKILEESPSPAVSDEKRMMMIPKVIDAVKKTGYTGA
ncbi:MAG: ATP-grasp domain-containing protein, partial [Firmicutes bacterium]|nr:ATP-grasp domain-containing protein [Bacillota bacterium]